MKHTKLKPWYKKPVEFTKADRVDITVAKATATIAVSSAQTADAKAVSAQSAAQSAQSAVATKASIAQLNQSTLKLNESYNPIVSDSLVRKISLPSAGSYITIASADTCNTWSGRRTPYLFQICPFSIEFYQQNKGISFYTHLYTSPDATHWYWHNVYSDDWIAASGTVVDNSKFRPDWIFIATMYGHYIYKRLNDTEGQWWTMNGDRFTYPSELTLCRRELYKLGSALPMRYRYTMQLRTDMPSAATSQVLTGADELNYSASVLQGYSRHYCRYPGDTPEGQLSGAAVHTRRETIGGIYNAIADCGGYHIFASSPGSGSDAETGGNTEGNADPVFHRAYGYNKNPNAKKPYTDNRFITGKSGESIVMTEGGGCHLKYLNVQNRDLFNQYLRHNLAGGSIGYCSTAVRPVASYSERYVGLEESHIISTDWTTLSSEKAICYAGELILPLYLACLAYQAEGYYSGNVGGLFTADNILRVLKGEFLETPQTDLFKHFLYSRFHINPESTDSYPIVLSRISNISLTQSGTYVDLSFDLASPPGTSYYYVVGPYHD